MWAGLNKYIHNKHFLSLAGNAVMAVISVVTIGLLFHHLTPAEVGGYAFFQAVVVLMDSVRTGFLQTALIKFYTGVEEKRANEVLGSIWYLGLLVTAIPFIITIPSLFALPYIDNIGTKLIIQWFSITFAFTLPIVVAHWILQSQGKFGKILYIRLLNQGSFIVFILALIATNRLTLQNAIWANLISCMITCLVIFAKKWAYLTTIGYRTKSGIKEIYTFGKFSLGTTVSSSLLRSSDTFIINFMLGPAAVAIYNLAQRLMEVIEIPLRSFMATGITTLSAASNRNDKEEVSSIMKKYAGTLTMLVLPLALGAILFADVLVGTLGGAKYMGTEAANIFRIFMLFGILFPIERFQGITLDMLHKPQLNLIKVTLMLVVNVVGDFAGLYLLGNVYGVALASIPTFLGGMVFGYHALRRNIDYNLTDVFKVGYKECKYRLAMQWNKRFASAG
ncbi:MAG: lipopolysaccharide biosynthesis protein [Sphingobacteriales bacterium]|nr:MAG: lipopolysaccharide biosynthesis protein [Sphingobacteriales bacterium]